jgi:hypothetical protein
MYQVFRCYCKLSKRVKDSILYTKLEQKYQAGVMSKEVPYIGKHRCDMVIYHPDGDIIYIEVDDSEHFTLRGSTKDNIFHEKFLENRKENEFLLRIDSRIIEEKSNILARRIYNWIPQKPITFAFLVGKNPFGKIELYEDEFEFLP